MHSSHKPDAVYSNLKGVSGIADDMFIYGTSGDDHDKNLMRHLKQDQRTLIENWIR